MNLLGRQWVATATTVELGLAFGSMAVGWIADAWRLSESLLFGVALLPVAALLPGRGMKSNGNFGR